MAGVALAWELLAKDTASPAFLRVAGAADKAAAATARSDAALAKSGGSATQFAARMSAVGTKLNKGLTLPLLALAAVSVDQAAKFQKSMTLIQTAGGETAAKTAVISKGIMSIATSTGTSLKDLGEGIYTVAKAGGTKWSAVDQLKILKAAAQGAKAENVDMATSVNALTSVMASYGYGADKAVAVQNMLIRGAGLAKTTMQDFAGSLSNVVPLASSLHISFAQVAGAIATMTQHGETAQRSTENLSNLISALAGQNNVASSAMQQLSINTVDLQENLGKRGLTGTLSVVEDALAKHSKGGMVVVSAFKQAALATHSLDMMVGTFQGTLKTNSEGLLKGSVDIKQYQQYAKSLGGTAGASALQFLGLYKSSQGFSDQLKSGNGVIRTSAAMLQKMLGGVTGMRVALMLGGASQAQFLANTKAIGKAAQDAGVDVLGWNKTSETLSVKMDKAKASLQVLAVEIGTALIPAVSKIVDWVRKGVTWFSNLSGTQKQILGWSLLIVASIGPVITILTRLYMAGRLVGLTFLKLGGAAVGMARFAKGLAMMNVGLATYETRTFSAGMATRGFFSAFGVGLGVLTAVAAAVGFGGKALSNWLEKGDSSVYMLNHLGSSAKGFTAALKASNGAISENVRTAVGKQLQDAGIADKAHKAGISIGMLTDAVVGGRPAMNDLIKTWRAAGKPADQTIQAFNAVWATYDAGVGKASSLAAKQRELNTVNLKTATGTSALRKGLQNTYAEQVPAAARATGALSSKVAAYHTNAIAAISVTAGLGNQLKFAALKGQALADALNNVDGGSIGTAEAFIAFKQAAHGLGAQFDKNNKSIVGNSDAALQNRGALLSAIDAAKAHGAAMTAQGDKAKTVAKALNGDIKSLENQAIAAGGSKKEIDKLLTSLGLMPKQVDTALHVNGTQLAKQQVLDVQAAIDRLHSKTITLTTILAYERQVGINPTSTHSQSGSGDRKPTAAGSRSVFGRADGTIPPNTTFTVGEGASHTWEGGHADAQGRVTIWSNKQSKAMGFRTPVGYAGGSGGIVHTGGNYIVTATGKRYASERAAQNAEDAWAKKNQGTLSSTASSAIGNVGSAYSPKFNVADVGIDRIRKQLAHAWDVLNAQIAKGLSTHAAKKYKAELHAYAELAQKQLASLRVKISTTDISSIKHAFGTSAQDMRDAFKTILADARLAGKSLKPYQQAESALLDKQKSYLAASTRLAGMKTYQNGIKSTLSGAFDPTQYGSVGDLISGLGGAAGKNNKYASQLNKLHKETKGNKTLTAFINQLAASGDTATLSTLAGASKSELGKVSTAVGGYNSSLTAGSQAATLEKYNTTVAAQTTATDKLREDMNKLVAALKHPKPVHVHVHVGKEEVANEVFDSHAAGRFMEELSHVVQHGRKP